jgi:hypothetical protein
MHLSKLNTEEKTDALARIRITTCLNTNLRNPGDDDGMPDKNKLNFY